MRTALIEQIEDGSYAGRIPACPGVIVFSHSERTCKIELYAALEDWILLGLKMGHTLPVISGIDINRKPIYEPLDAMQA
jgi:predicted RNase H-like HicB family nuclease